MFDCTYHHHRHRCRYNRYASSRWCAYSLIAVSAISLLTLLWLLYRWHYANTCCDALILAVFKFVVNSFSFLCLRFCVLFKFHPPFFRLWSTDRHRHAAVVCSFIHSTIFPLYTTYPKLHANDYFCIQKFDDQLILKN